MSRRTWQTGATSTSMWSLFAALTLVTMLAASPASADVPSLDADVVDDLPDHVDTLLADKALEGATVGIVVTDLATGKELVAKNGAVAQNPASNTKLVTAAAALQLLGPGYRTSTEIWSDAPSGGVLKGDLIVVGKGDPSLGFGDLVEWGQEIAALGVKTVQGDLVVDDTFFEDAPFPPAFEQKPSNAAYAAPISAFAVDRSAFDVAIKPGKAGDPPTVGISPSVGYVKVVNQAKTKAGTKQAKLSFDLVKDGEGVILTVKGTVPPSKKLVIYKRYRVLHPSLYAGLCLKKALALSGVTVKGKVKRGAPSHKGKARLARFWSPIVAELVFDMNKYSDNFVAEMVFRHLDPVSNKPKTHAGAQKVVMAFLKDTVGLDTKDVVVKNGSGLYDANRISSKGLVGLIAWAAKDPLLGPELIASLAIAGEDGTLKYRYKKDTTPGTKLRGKTGTLDEVIALSGLMITKGGGAVALSILVTKAKGQKLSAYKVKKAVDGFLGFLGTM